MKLIHQLRATSSRLAKEQHLRNISHNEWRVFVYAYHPDSIYHMKWPSANIHDIGEPNEQMFTLLDSILDGNITGNKAKARVQSFVSIHGSLIKFIINKDLDCGVTATIFNKIYPESIPQFKVQLAKEIDIKTIAYPVLAQLKYDGVRLIAMIENRKCTFKTRNGKKVHLLHLAEAIEALPFDNYILDGEIVLASGKMEDRTKISGMINSAMHGGRVNQDDMVLHIFDTMPLSEFNACECDTIYDDRFAILNKILETNESDHLAIAPTNEVHSAEAATNLYEGALAMGYEGLVLKYPRHKYTFKRSKDWIKVKEVKHADLKVIGIEPGQGKYDGMTGALICEGMVEGKEVKVNVGSDLTDLQRSDYYLFLYKTVEVLYNAVIKDSVTNQYSLFLPRFVQVRYDK